MFSRLLQSLLLYLLFPLGNLNTPLFLHDFGHEPKPSVLTRAVNGVYAASMMLIRGGEETEMTDGGEMNLLFPPLSFTPLSFLYHLLQMLACRWFRWADTRPD